MLVINLHAWSFSLCVYILEKFMCTNVNKFIHYVTMSVLPFREMRIYDCKYSVKEFESVSILMCKSITCGYGFQVI